METISLGRAKELIECLNTFKGEADYNSLIAHARKKTRATAHEVEVVLEFLKDFQTIEILESEGSLMDQVDILANKEINLADELQYNYAVAKTLLQFIIAKNTLPDGEEIRKTLREISRFSDAMLKMQERVYNIQQLQLFQEKVLSFLTEEQATLLLEAPL